jgi:DNA replication protein DnaC
MIITADNILAVILQRQPDFQLTHQNYEVMHLMAQYISNNPKFELTRAEWYKDQIITLKDKGLKRSTNSLFNYYCLQYEAEKDNHQSYSLNKSLGFVGPPGTFKTSFMKVLNTFYNELKHPRRFKILNLKEDILLNYKEHGEKSLNGNDQLHLCIDEFGLINEAEEKVMHYGNKINMVEYLASSRYNTYTNNQKLTHFTTNISFDDFQNRYLESAVSRIYEMSNIIPVLGENMRYKAKPTVIVDNTIPEQVKELDEEAQKRAAEAREAFFSSITINKMLNKPTATAKTPKKEIYWQQVKNYINSSAITFEQKKQRLQEIIDNATTQKNNEDLTLAVEMLQALEKLQ